MIDLYTWPTPNGHKIHIMLEETGLPYKVIPVDIGAGDQFKPEFLKISPNNKMPAMVDHDGPGGKPMALAESGAILFYLASKTGKFLPKDARKRYDTMQWLFFQMAHIGPMFGQANHFNNYAKDNIQYAKDRYNNESVRLYRVLDNRLRASAWVGCDEYTVADMAIYPWVARHEWHRVDLAAFPNVKRWYDALGKRPAVAKGMNVPPTA